jgi:hypothetical protein
VFHLGEAAEAEEEEEAAEITVQTMRWTTFYLAVRSIELRHLGFSALKTRHKNFASEVDLDIYHAREEEMRGCEVM